MASYLDLVEKIKRNQESPSAAEDLEYIVHYFFDDTELAKKADEYIGVILISKDEALAIGKFGELLDEYLDKFSPGASPVIFEDGEDWKVIKIAARQALNIIESAEIS